MFKIIWRYIRGTVEVRCDGGFFHRFFNRAMDEKLGVFKVKVKGNTARFFVFIRDYKALRPIAKKSQCRLRVERKHGLYFAWRRLPNKAALIAGLLAFCTVIALFGNMVFAIEIKGTSTIPKNVLLASLERNGLRIGMWSREVDPETVGNAVLLENGRLGWIAVNLSFGIATVEVEDRFPDPEKAPPDGPLLASRDGQIKTFTSTGGNVLVRPGDVVRQGQTLVEPVAELADSWTAAASAIVMAYTERTVVFTLERNHIYRTPTGNRTMIKTLNLGRLSVPLSLGRNPYTYFDVLNYELPVWIFNVEMPWRIAVTEYIEVDQWAVALNRAQAQVLCDEYLKNYEQGELAGCEVLNREISLDENDARFVYTVQYLCLENIAIYGDHPAGD